jgi:hypothetical protein
VAVGVGELLTLPHGDERAEVVRAGSFQHGFFDGDLMLQHEIAEGLVERLHPIFGAGLDDACHLMSLTFADQVADGRGGHEDFLRARTAFSLDGL